MSLITSGIVLLIAVVHLYIMWFEMFRWTSKGPKVFKQFPKDLFEPTRAMAANQGLYNGFLAAGLLWSLFITNQEWQRNIALCFLLFVLLAGLYAAATASRKILFVQALPAAIGIISLFIF